MVELEVFKNASGLFGLPMSVRQREMKSPDNNSLFSALLEVLKNASVFLYVFIADWWSTYGSSAPNLRDFAVKVLSLTCSASGCERNWSVFQHVSLL